MSKTIDERIVSMQFDNKSFEKNVSTTMGTLDKLNQNFKNIENTACQAGFSLRDVWLKVSNVFEYQIAGRIINAGKNMVSALTIDPIKTGLSEYETQLNSVQTILANTESKGSTLDDVNRALDELNAYADKTIYNFTEMTRNIGTFTAAGVDLDTSVSAIKGIANLAAVSGSTSQQASTAMYQLSQALASGTVKLMDWNSVVNAGMGGQVFQDALKETARLHGIAIDQIIKDQGSFRESLSEGWLSSEILTETLAKFTGDLTEEQLKSMGYTEKQIKEIMKLGQTANDAATKVKTFTQLIDTLKEAAQSGWAQTWELVIGDFEEAKALWTNVSDVFGGMISTAAETRNNLLTGALTSGWDQLINTGVYDEAGYTHYIKTVAKEHGVAIDEMIEQEGSLEKALRKGFKSGELSSDMLTEALVKLYETNSKLTDEQLKNLGFTKDQVNELGDFIESIQNGSVSIEDFADKMSRLSGRELIIESFSNMFKALTKVMKPIKEAFREIFPKTTSEQLYKLLERFRDFTAKLAISEETADKLKRTFKGLFALISIGISGFKAIAKAIGVLINALSPIANALLSATASLGDFIVQVREANKASQGLADVTQSLKNFVSILKEKFASPFFTGLLKVIKIVWTVTKSIIDQLAKMISDTFTGNGDAIGTIFDILNAGLLTAFILKLKNVFSSFSKIASSFGDIIDSITGPLQGLQDKLKSEALKNIAIAIAILAGSMLVLSLIDPERLNSAMAAIIVALASLLGAMAIMDKIGASGIRKTVKMAGIVTSLLILSTALLLLGQLSPEELTIGIIAMNAGLASMIGTIKLLSMFESKDAKKGTKQLTKIAFSLLILSFALKRLGDMPWSGLAKSLISMNVALATMVGAIYLLTLFDSEKAKQGTKQLTKIAVSMLVLSFALKRLGDMSWGGIAKSLTAITVALGVMVGVVYLLTMFEKNDSKKGTKQLTKIAVSMLVLSFALKNLGDMSWNEIAKSLVAMSVALGVMVGSLYLMSKMGKAKGVGKLLVMATSLIIVGASLKILATMSWGEILKGLVTMTVALGVLVGAMALMSLISQSGFKSIASAASLLILAAALAVLIPVLLALGNMKTETIVKGLLTIAATFAIIGVAGLLLKSVVPSILAFSASLLVLGVAVLLIGTGVGILAAGIAALIHAIVELVTTVVKGVGEIAKAIVVLIPALAVGLATGLIELCKVLRDGAPVIGETIVSILLSVIDACVEVIPKLVEGVMQILIGVLESLVNHIPQIVEAIMKIIIGIIEAIGKHIPALVESLIGLLMKVFEGIVAALKKIDTTTIIQAIGAIGLLAVLMGALSMVAGLVPGAMLGLLGVAAVVAELAIILAAFGALSKIPGLTKLIDSGGNLLLAIGTAIGKFVGGILGGIAEGITNSLPALGANLSAFMVNLQPFLHGLKAIDESTLNNAKSLAALLLVITAANIVEQLTSWLTGGSSMAEFGNELAKFGEGLAKFADATSGIKDLEKVKIAAETGKLLGEMAKAIPSSGGLWSIIGGKKDMKKFGESLSAFGNGVAKFAAKVSGISDMNKIKTAAEAGKLLGEMAKSMPSSGGLWNVISGKKDMGEFGSQLEKFASSMVKFEAISAPVSPDNISKGVASGKELAGMASTLPMTGGLWQAIRGEVDMAKFGDQLTLFAEGVKAFAENMAGVGDISSISKQLDTLYEALANFGQTGLNSINTGFAKIGSNLNKSINETLNASITAISSKKVIFKAVGQTLVSEFLSGAQNVLSKVKNTFTTLIKTISNTIGSKNSYAIMYDSGTYLALGLAKGIEDSTSVVVAKAEAMARAANEAVRKILKINSPSKVTEDSGDSFGEGFINALTRFAKISYAAGSDMADEALSGLMYTLLRISDVIDSGIDGGLTIKPVLDLSDVSAGANAINGMFNMSPSVGVLSNVRSINSMMNKNQNGSTTADVVSSIKDLKQLLENTSGDTYNINGITYDNGSELSAAIETIIRAAKIDRRR